MSRECKSCGRYFNGDKCDNCGWEPKSGTIIMNEGSTEERAESLQSHSEDIVSERHSDPNAGKNFLLTVAAAAVVLVVFALWKSGAIFSNTREEVVTQYFKAISEGDYDSFVKCFPKEIKADYEHDRVESGLDKKAYMQGLYGDMYSAYGSKFTIKAIITSEEKLDKSEYDMTAYTEQYGTSPELDEVYEVVTDVEFSGELSSDKALLCLYVAHSGGRWRIFGMTEDMGLMNEENVG